MTKPEAKNQKPKYKKDIYNLTLIFSLNFHKFLKTLPIKFSSKHILNQAFRSSSSISANMIESQNSLNKKELTHKQTIALKEAKETLYWIKLLEVEYPNELKNFSAFTVTLTEIIAILISCIRKLRLQSHE